MTTDVAPCGGTQMVHGFELIAGTRDPTDTARIIDVIEQTTARTNADWTITTGPGAGPQPSAQSASG